MFLGIFFVRQCSENIENIIEELEIIFNSKYLAVSITTKMYNFLNGNLPIVS